MPENLRHISSCGPTVMTFFMNGRIAEDVTTTTYFRASNGNTGENGRFRIGWTTASGKMAFRCRVWYLAQTFEKHRIVAVMIQYLLASEMAALMTVVDGESWVLRMRHRASAILHHRKLK